MVSGDVAVPKNVLKTVLSTVDIPQEYALESVPKVSPENPVKTMSEVVINMYFFASPYSLKSSTFVLPCLWYSGNKAELKF